MREETPDNEKIDCLLRQLEEKDSIINGISDALMLLDAKTYRILDVNQAFLNVYQIPYDQAVGKTCYETTHRLTEPCHLVSEHDSCPMKETISTGRMSHTEHEHTGRDGQKLYFEITAYPLSDSDGHVSRVVHLSRNITDRKRAEKALQESSEKIKVFAYSIAHDLKSPTVGIHGLIQLLLKNYRDHLDEKAGRYCTQIMKAAEEISALVEKISVYISAKEAPLNVEAINLEGIYQMLQEEFSMQPQAHQVTWRRPATAPEIRADRLAITRVLRNLIDNALKYGGDALSEVELGYDETDEFHILSVGDDGVGIRQADSERLFDLFVRKEHSGGIKGVGLGLAIVKEIAEQHGGKVWTVPTNESGATFFVAISKNL